MNHDLIKQLQSLSPTEGEWYTEHRSIWAEDILLYESTCSTDHDDTLVYLAPTMRLEILAMAKEIEELRSQLSLAHELLKTQPK